MTSSSASFLLDEQPMEGRRTHCGRAEAQASAVSRGDSSCGFLVGGACENTSTRSHPYGLVCYI
eukprot:800242-Prymnesium_polylepis.1